MPELPPTSPERVEADVIDIVAEAADRAATEIQLDDHLYQRIGVESLGAVSILVALRARYGIPEPASEAEFMLLDTPRKLVGHVLAYIGNSLDRTHDPN